VGGWVGGRVSGRAIEHGEGGRVWPRRRPPAGAACGGCRRARTACRAEVPQHVGGPQLVHCGLHGRRIRGRDGVHGRLRRGEGGGRGRGRGRAGAGGRGEARRRRPAARGTLARPSPRREGVVPPPQRQPNARGACAGCTHRLRAARGIPLLRVCGGGVAGVAAHASRRQHQNNCMYCAHRWAMGAGAWVHGLWREGGRGRRGRRREHG
jgi:hypothetical protein